MSDELPLDDAPAPFAEEVRFAVSGPPPVPSPALAAVLRSGFSDPTDKGDPPVTAGSNVHGPAPQVAGLPNWKKEREMALPGVFAGFLATLGSASTAAKAALAGVAAVTTLGLVGGAAGVLPGPAQDAVAGAVSAVTPFELPATGDVTDIVQGAVPALPGVDTTLPQNLPVPNPPPVSASAGVKSGPSGASASASTSASSPASAGSALPGVTVPSVPQVTVPPAVAGLVGNLPACVRDMIPAGGGTPDPTKLAAQIQACIPQVLSTANLPPEVAKCVSTVLGTIGGVNGLNPTSVPGVSGLSMSSCVPMDASKCVTSMMGLLSTLPTTGGVPNLSSLSGLGTISGCVPMDVTKCLTSITSALSTGPVTGGAVPRIDLSACMPTGLPATGLPSFGSIPGFSGALPFLTR